MEKRRKEEEGAAPIVSAWPFRGPFMEPGDGQSGTYKPKVRHPLRGCKHPDVDGWCPDTSGVRRSPVWHVLLRLCSALWQLSGFPRLLQPSATN